MSRCTRVAPCIAGLFDKTSQIMDHPTVQGHNAHQGSVRWEAQIDVHKNWRCEFANKLSYMAFCQAPCNLRRWKKHILWLYLQIDLNFIHMSGLCVAFFSLKGIFLGAFLNPSAAPRWWPLQQSRFPASKSNPENMGLVEPMFVDEPNISPLDWNFNNCPVVREGLSQLFI